MKTITSNYVTRLMLAFFLVLAFHVTASAQTGNYISWNNQVGCISYDSNGEPDNPRKELILLEEIEDGPCIRVCEGRSVNYVMNGPNIANVQWSAAGGSITSISGPGNKNATVAWGAPGSGAINLTVLYTNGTQANYTLCIEIINGPRADFKIYGVGDYTFCYDTPINFQNLSNNNGGSEIVYYMWDFGDDEYSYEFEPTHTYSQPGIYNVTLVVTNNCNCTHKYTMQIIIEDKPNVVINCPSVVCEDDKPHTYTVNDCGGSWEVQGGTIVGQTATSVDVLWDSVDEFGFGYVSFRSECTCPFWTTVKIPVLKNEGDIQGSGSICLGDQGLYTLPQWPTTDFNWTIFPNNGGAQIIYNDQRNQIYIEGVIPGYYELRCDYINTLLGCKGKASIKIHVVEGMVITSNQPDEFCSSSGVKTYTTTSGAPVNWQLKKNNSVIANTTGVNFSYNFTSGGVYTLTATIAGGCAGQPKVITVTQTPANPTGTITGENRICAGVPYEYTLNNTVPNTVFVWEVLPAGAGTIQGDNTGNNVTIIFNSSVTGVRVKRVSLDGLGCESGWLTMAVAPISFTATITNTAGLSLFCPSSQTSFTAAISGGTPDMVEWSFADTNFGNIINGINSNTVNVSFNEIQAGQTTTNLVLKVTKCGVITTFNYPVTLISLPTLTLNAPAQVCYGGNINLTLSAPGVTTGTVTFDFGNGIVMSNVPLNLSGNYSFPNPYNNATGSNINQTITATLNTPNGCNYAPQATDTILVFPKTTIAISPGYNYQVCPPNYSPIVLQANATTGIGMTVSYKWFKGGVQIPGATSSSYTISTGTQGSTPQGTYYVQATDSNGCIVNSQSITVSVNCGPPPTCIITPNPNLNVTATWSACGTITANATYAGTPSNVQWVGSPLITLQSSNNTSATFSTNTPGAHLVTAFVTYQTPNGPCTVQQTTEVKTHYKPNFNTIVSCNSGGQNITYNVTLVDNSTVFDAGNLITYTWTGPGISGSATGQSVTLPPMAPGTYNYTLTLSMPGKPSCTITKPLTLAAAPNPVFSISNDPVCSEDSFNLTIQSYNPVNSYKFFFNGTSYVASGASTAIQIDSNGQFDITLEITTPQGCVFTSVEEVDVIQASFPGTIKAVPNITTFCEGNASPVLEFAPAFGAPTPSQYVWMKGNQQVGTSSSYTPTTSGNYWVKLYNAQGCEFVPQQSINITISQRPYAGIIGNTSLCAGDSGTVQGVVTNNTLQRRWLLNGNPMPAPYGTWSTTTPLTINVPASSGTYNYTFEVRPSTDITCGSTASLTVTVYQPIAAPVISYSVLTCEPYQVQVSASGPGSGTYNWSNGSVGQTIYVGHGGALSVTYTATTGCSASSTSVMIPQPLDRMLWVFPSGCYDVCLNTIPTPYILGPLGIFDSYQWLVNGNVGASGTNSSVAALPVTQAGTYQLNIADSGCYFESDVMNVAPNLKECEIVPCEFKADVKMDAMYEGGYYFVDGYIHNTSGSSITVTITSFNNYGTYSPNTVTIAPGAYFYFGPIQFTPNANFTGGNDYIVLQMDGCMTLFRVKFPTIEGQGFFAGKPAALSVVPNPAQDFTVVTYDLGDKYKAAESLVVYNLLGNEMFTTKLDKTAGEINLSIAGLPSGTYIVSVQADGVRAIQQILVKK